MVRRLAFRFDWLVSGAEEYEVVVSVAREDCLARWTLPTEKADTADGNLTTDSKAVESMLQRIGRLWGIIKWEGDDATENNKSDDARIDLWFDWWLTVDVFLFFI